MTDLQMIVVVLAVCQFLFEYFLKVLNEKHVANLIGAQPEESKSLMDDETWRKASNYSISKSRFSRVEEIFGFVIFFPVFLYVLPTVFEIWPVTLFDSVWWGAFVATALLNVLQIPGLFFDWYNQFTLEEKFGFNKSTKKLWVMDKVKGMILGFVLSYLLLALLIWLYRTISEASPAYWWAMAFVVFFGIQLLMMVLYPKLILPLFNKLTPLEDGELKDRLMALSDKTGFKANTIEVIDGSKRSGHSNAYFTGFGRFRRIVLYDTLIKQMSIEEIEAVLAHEVGHYKMGHIPKRLVMSFVMGLAGFGLMGYLLESAWFYSGLGLDVSLISSLSPLIIGLSLTLGFFTYWLTPVSNLFSRKHEFEADHFAKIAVGGEEPLISALRKLYVENLSHPLPHPLMAGFHYSHPTLLEREGAMRAN
ncbi:MAG: M48 family metallopeptidase [Opitutales bacterium]|nr:M48 family metallopeptidase [Opitutales bacterium]